MALIDCPDCKRQVSDLAVSCPQCGFPIAESRPQPEPPPLPSNSPSTVVPPPPSIWKPRPHGLLVIPVFFAVPLLIGEGLVIMAIGSGLILFCLGLPNRNLANWLLRIRPGSNASLYLRKAFYACVGLAVLTFGWSDHEFEKRQKERVVAQAQADHALDTLVAEKTEAATALLGRGETNGVVELLNEICSSAAPRHRDKIHQVETGLANLRMEPFVAAAQIAATNGLVAQAKTNLALAFGIQNATPGTDARRLKRFLHLVDNTNLVNQLLAEVSDKVFEAVVSKGVMPQGLISGYPGLDLALAQFAAQRTEDARALREVRRAADEFVKNGKGKTVPFEKWPLFGYPQTLPGTGNKYWVVYLPKADVSFISLKEGDTVVHVSRGKNSTMEIARSLKQF